jgi:hypothetical protein
MSVIDTKLLGKPPRFEDDIAQCKQQCFQTMTYFGALYPDMHDDLSQAEVMQTPVMLQDLSAAKEDKSRAAFYVLSQLLVKAPLKCSWPVGTTTATRLGDC